MENSIQMNNIKARRKEAEEEYRVIDSDDHKDTGSESQEDSDVGDLIDDIFGKSDDEGEFKGFGIEDFGSNTRVDSKKEKKVMTEYISDDSDWETGEEEEMENGNDCVDCTMEGVSINHQKEKYDDMHKKKKSKRKAAVSDNSDEDGIRKMREDIVYDFDIMMQKKKEGSRRRKKKYTDFINNSDDLIADIIAKMQTAAEEDRELNKKKEAATKKLRMLPMVMSQLKKQDLKMSFLDQGVLSVMAEWLTPLPDRSLPHLQIRESMLKQLLDFPSIGKHHLNSSGIGRAVMYLHKHPKESKLNKLYSRTAITLWGEHIFNVVTDYRQLPREERLQQYGYHIPKKSKISDEDKENSQESVKDIGKALSGGISFRHVSPGDKNWIGRAQVPLPSNKEYINRPKWNVETEFSMDTAKKPLSRLEKHIKSLQEQRRKNKNQRAITISIEGRRMAI